MRFTSLSTVHRRVMQSTSRQSLHYSIVNTTPKLLLILLKAKETEHENLGFVLRSFILFPNMSLKNYKVGMNVVHNNHRFTIVNVTLLIKSCRSAPTGELWPKMHHSLFPIFHCVQFHTKVEYCWAYMNFLHIIQLMYYQRCLFSLLELQASYVICVYFKHNLKTIGHLQQVRKRHPVHKIRVAPQQA